MKSDLIISRYKTECVIGTKSSFDARTFFGSKMIDIEDNISIDDSSIQYSEVSGADDKREDGYQYYIDADEVEKYFLIDLNTIKINNYSITLSSQHDIELKTITKWNINIKWKNILVDYIFLKLKEARTFKAIKYSDVLNENINIYIKSYITDNLLSRYNFESIDFYIKYVDLENGNEHTTPNLSLNPVYDATIKSVENKIQNLNNVVFSDYLDISYNQTESSKNKTFHYYFELNMVKI